MYWHGGSALPMLTMGSRALRPLPDVLVAGKLGSWSGWVRLGLYACGMMMLEDASQSESHGESNNAAAAHNGAGTTLQLSE